MNLVVLIIVFSLFTVYKCMYWIWEIEYDLFVYGIVFLLQMYQYLFI